MRPYALLIGAAILLEIAMNLSLGAMPLELVKEGASPSAVALAMGCGMFAMLLFSLPTGALTDRFGRLFMMRLSAGLMMLVLVGMSVTHGVWWGALFLGLRSTALTSWFSAKFAYASNLFAEKRSISTIVSLGMFGNVIFAIGPALGVALEQSGVGREQYAYATISVLLGMVLIAFLPAVHDVRSVPVERTATIRASWLPAMAFLAGAKMEIGVNFSLAVLTFHDRGITNGALLFTVAALTGFFMRLPAGRLVERFGSRRIALPVVLLQASACCLAASAHSTTSVVLTGILFGTGGAGVLPVGLGLLFEQSERESRGAAMGAYNFSCAAGSVVGALVAAFSVSVGLGYPFAITACAAVPLAILPFVLGFNLRNILAAKEESVLTLSPLKGIERQSNS